MNTTKITQEKRRRRKINNPIKKKHNVNIAFIPILQNRSLFIDIKDTDFSILVNDDNRFKQYSNMITNKYAEYYNK